MDTITTLGDLREVLEAEAKDWAEVDTDALRERYARYFFHNDATPAALGLLGQPNMHPAGRALLSEVLETMPKDPGYASVLAQMAPGATCPTCGQSGPSKPGSEPCRHCGRNTVHDKTPTDR
jgi:hypothetical protein